MSVYANLQQQLRRTSRDKSTHDGTGLSGNLHGDSVGLGDMRTPVTSSNGNDGELGVDDGTSDGTGDFLGTLHSESDVSDISSHPITPVGRARSRITGNMSQSHKQIACYPASSLTLV